MKKKPYEQQIELQKQKYVTVYACVPKTDIFERKYLKKVEKIDLVYALLNSFESKKKISFFNQIQKNLEFNLKIFGQKLGLCSLNELTENDMVYIPLKINANLVKNKKLLKFCNLLLDTAIKNSFHILWKPFLPHAIDTIIFNSLENNMTFYTTKVKSIEIIYLVCTQSNYEIDTTYAVFPVFVNTFDKNISSIVNNFSSLKDPIIYNNINWKIVYATRWYEHPLPSYPLYTVFL